MNIHPIRIVQPDLNRAIVIRLALEGSLDAMTLVIPVKAYLPDIEDGSLSPSIKNVET